MARTIEIFSEAYADSLKQYPNHNIPLVAILAGKNIKDDKGFICSLSSNYKFEPFLIEDAGSPYFSGSNTNLVASIASMRINMIYHSNIIQLDRWAIESLKDISMIDKHVGFPVQLVKIENNNYVEKFPIETNTSLLYSEFQIKL